MTLDRWELPPRRQFRFEGTVPGDKSITHRAYLLSCLASGDTEIEGPLRSADTDATARAVELLGATLTKTPRGVLVRGTGGRLKEPQSPVDCLNAGTLMRLLAGAVAPRDILCVLTGDASLSARPMGRVVEPLRQLGAEIHARGQDRYAPIAILPSRLRGTEIAVRLASAQVKSLLLLAALGAEGETVLTDLPDTRDHTERMLRSFGAKIHIGKGRISLAGEQELRSPEAITVPGDISHAAFLLAAAAAVDGGEAHIQGVGLNPGRTGILDVLAKMGARVQREIVREEPEPWGNVHLTGGRLRGVHVFADEVPGLIDELPVIAALALVAEGETVVEGAGELRQKESDRIRAVRLMAEGLGGRLEETEDGFCIEGTGGTLRGGVVESLGDHRIAMAAAILSLRSEHPVEVLGASASAVSFPEFYDFFTRSSV